MKVQYRSMKVQYRYASPKHQGNSSGHLQSLPPQLILFQLIHMAPCLQANPNLSSRATAAPVPATGSFLAWRLAFQSQLPTAGPSLQNQFPGCYLWLVAPTHKPTPQTVLVWPLAGLLFPKMEELWSSLLHEYFMGLTECPREFRVYIEKTEEILLSPFCDEEQRHREIRAKIWFCHKPWVRKGADQASYCDSRN